MNVIDVHMLDIDSQWRRRNNFADKKLGIKTENLRKCDLPVFLKYVLKPPHKNNTWSPVCGRTVLLLETYSQFPVSYAILFQTRFKILFRS